VYVGDAAICAVGLAVRRMTSMHGLALNVSTSLNYDALIVPCGTMASLLASLALAFGVSLCHPDTMGTAVEKSA
jgi:lipoate-protein ligase B